MLPRQPGVPHPARRPAASAAGRSRIWSPIATPPLGSPPTGAEDPERQVLDREVRVAIGRGDPAPELRVVSVRRAKPSLRITAGSG